MRFYFIYLYLLTTLMFRDEKLGGSKQQKLKLGVHANSKHQGCVRSLTLSPGPSKLPPRAQAAATHHPHKQRETTNPSATYIKVDVYALLLSVVQVTSTSNLKFKPENTTYFGRRAYVRTDGRPRDRCQRHGRGFRFNHISVNISVNTVRTREPVRYGMVSLLRAKNDTPPHKQEDSPMPHATNTATQPGSSGSKESQHGSLKTDEIRRVYIHSLCTGYDTIPPDGQLFSCFGEDSSHIGQDRTASQPEPLHTQHQSHPPCRFHRTSIHRTTR